jgi:hypothetical protein
MSTVQNAQHLLLQGLDQARGEWLLLAACHNQRHRHRAGVVYDNQGNGLVFYSPLAR